LNALAFFPECLQEGLYSAGRQISNKCSLATLKNPPHSTGNKLHLLGADALRLKVALEIREMIQNGPLPMLIKSVHDPGDSALDLLDQFIEHRLSSRLVCRQGNATLLAVLVAVAPPPFLRLRGDLLPSLRVGDFDRLFEKACHYHS